MVISTRRKQNKSTGQSQKSINSNIGDNILNNEQNHPACVSECGVSGVYDKKMDEALENKLGDIRTEFRREIHEMKDDLMEKMVENVRSIIKKELDVLPIANIGGDQLTKEVVSSLSPMDDAKKPVVVELSSMMKQYLKSQIKEIYYQSIKFANDKIAIAILELEIEGGAITVPKGVPRQVFLKKNEGCVRKHITDLRQNSTGLAKKNWKGKRDMVCGWVMG